MNSISSLKYKTTCTGITVFKVSKKSIFFGVKDSYHRNKNQNQKKSNPTNVYQCVFNLSLVCLIELFARYNLQTNTRRSLSLTKKTAPISQLNKDTEKSIHPNYRSVSFLKCTGFYSNPCNNIRTFCSSLKAIQ